MHRARLPRRWWARLAVVVGAFVVLAVPVAWASHNFTDVPNSNPHHDDISAIFGARITTGCTPTLYCPGDAVTRQQMASFLRRGLGRTGGSGTTADLTLTAAYQNLATDSITAGGATGGSGFVIVLGHFTALAPFNSLGTNHRMLFKVRQNGTGFESNESSATLYHNTLTGAPSTTVSKMWVFSQPTGTTESYSLQARIVFGDQPVAASSRLIQVLYVPFGAAGTSALGGLLQQGGNLPTNIDTP